MISPQEKGGVEETKEDTDHNVSPNALRNRPSASSEIQQDDDEQTHGFQAQLQRFAKVVFGSCGSAIESAACYVQQQGCRWPDSTRPEPSPVHKQSAAQNDAYNKPELSIADELRMLAQKEGRPFPPPNPFMPHRTDIPKFLGEEAVYSFEDDNISALSQHTLEEMNHSGKGRYFRRRSSANDDTEEERKSGSGQEADGRQKRNDQNASRDPPNKIHQESSQRAPTPPSPARTASLSTNSSKGKEDVGLSGID